MMKKHICLILAIFVLFGCEDVIEVDVPSEEPRLLIDALFRVDISQEFIPVEVKVSTTNSFFETIPATSSERIFILIEELDE
jgi:hypothetical protein